MVNVTVPRCLHCGEQEVVQLTTEEFEKMNSGIFLQNALPNRDADFRELLITGTHASCWNEMFPEDEE